MNNIFCSAGNQPSFNMYVIYLNLSTRMDNLFRFFYWKLFEFIFCPAQSDFLHLAQSAPVSISARSWARELQCRIECGRTCNLRSLCARNWNLPCSDDDATEKLFCANVQFQSAPTFEASLALAHTHKSLLIKKSPARAESAIYNARTLFLRW